ncbi:S-layer homology domain-containing protein [Butyricicoccus sp.]|uniref:S-layer homology domain-containing protein n=1 Tax=Butyricicoccus sp. TaxID=2049021 RepID=UPI0037352368
MKKILSFALAAALLLGGLPTQSFAAGFTDIEGHWAEESINRAVEKGLFSGVSDTEFQPDGTMTRAMFVTVMAKYSGYTPSKYKTDKFKDVPSDAWYAPAVAWAVQNGIVSGTSDNTFSPNAPVSRQQAAVILVAYSNAAGVILPRTRPCTGFSDNAQCADYALDAVYTLYRAGLVDGLPGGSFGANHGMTRAQCAVILCGYLDICARSCTDAEKISMVNHRGYSYTAPENTLPAYQVSAQKGYTYVEADIRFSADGEPVLLHDATINRTSNVEEVTGSDEAVYLSGCTLAQLQTYDFGSWKAERYAGTKIPTFRDFIALCAQNGLHPYIELKQQMTQQQVGKLVDIVKEYDMYGNVTWISFYSENLAKLRSVCPTAELMLLAATVDTDSIQAAKNLKNGKNSVLLSVRYNKLTAAQRAACLRAGLDFGVWTVDSKADAIRQTNTSAMFLTTDSVTWDTLYSG